MPRDPKQFFTVTRLSRAGIADWLNDGLEDNEDFTSVKKFAEDDDRLTDELCAAIADGHDALLDFVAGVAEDLSDLPHEADCVLTRITLEGIRDGVMFKDEDIRKQFDERDCP